LVDNGAIIHTEALAHELENMQRELENARSRLRELRVLRPQVQRARTELKARIADARALVLARKIVSREAAAAAAAKTVSATHRVRERALANMKQADGVSIERSQYVNQKQRTGVGGLDHGGGEREEEEEEEEEEEKEEEEEGGEEEEGKHLRLQIREWNAMLLGKEQQISVLAEKSRDLAARVKFLESTTAAVKEGSVPALVFACRYNNPLVVRELLRKGASCQV
jgi:hypothetical protein